MGCHCTMPKGKIDEDILEPDFINNLKSSAAQSGQKRPSM